MKKIIYSHSKKYLISRPEGTANRHMPHSYGKAQQDADTDKDLSSTLTARAREKKNLLIQVHFMNLLLQLRSCGQYLEALPTHSIEEVVIQWPQNSGNTWNFFFFFFTELPLNQAIHIMYFCFFRNVTLYLSLLNCILLFQCSISSTSILILLPWCLKPLPALSICKFYKHHLYFISQVSSENIE